MVDYHRTCTCCDERSVAVVEVAPDLEMAMCAEHLARRERRAEGRERVAVAAS